MTFRIAILFAASSLLAAPPLTVTSPDGNVIVGFTLDAARPFYSVAYRGSPLLAESGLGLTFRGSGAFAAGLEVRGVRTGGRSGTWKPAYGERSEIPENYREAVIDLAERGGALRRVRLTIRAYNEGAAFRYTIPEQEAMREFVIESEQSEFRLPEGTRAWQTHGAKQPYENVWVKDVLPECERPLVIEYPGGKFAALAEAGLRDYARMLLSPAPGKPWTLVTTLSGGPAAGTEPDPGGPVRIPHERASSSSVWGEAPFSTPWRAIIAGDRAGDLLERNYLLLNLNEPSRIADTSWIKPGKVMREVTLSTRGGKELVDFAKKRNLQYIEYDAGWYGHEYDDASDATRVDIGPLRLNPDPQYRGLDLREVIAYARQKGIGVLLYVNRRALERQLGTLLPLYKEWGVAGCRRR